MRSDHGSASRGLVLALAFLVALTTIAGAEDGPTPAGKTLSLDPSIDLEAPDQVELMRYLVRCALPADVVIDAEVGGKQQSFEGDLGLAPKWVERPLTPGEQRWVSACMLALTNKFGKHVRISLRARPPAAKNLTASQAERESHTLFEGGFHGNIFSDSPTAYVCLGRRSRAEQSDAILKDRVCTEPSGLTLDSGETLTRCGFILTGVCSDPDAGDGGPREIIYVYLKPLGPAQD